MDLSLVESLVRGAGGLLTVATLSAIYYGIWRGMSRSAGRRVAPFSGWLHSPLFYLLASGVFFGICIALWRPIPLPLSQEGRVLALVFGSLPFLTGLGFVLWGRLALGRMYFVSTGLGAQLFADHELVVRGPYAIVRHPMYAGIAVAAVGGLCLYRTWTFVALLLLPPGLLRRACREEEALAAEFGEAWRNYCRRVPAFVPRLGRRPE